MPTPTPGTILGAYCVEGQLGAGSMGEVYRTVDTGLNRRVAVKILSEKHRDSPELRQRFVREGRTVATISHPNVVQVFATGSFDDRPYIAMELLDGIDLGSTVEKTGPLSSVEAAHAMLDAAHGLAAAAKAGLIHRDVKPSNLVRLSDGKVKVTDFGLAKSVDPGSEPALTATRSRLRVRNDGISTWIVYVSAAMFGRTKSPRVFVTTGASFVPRASLISVTVAPGTTPPCSSFTVPDIVPVIPCATVEAARITTSRTAMPARPRIFHTNRG